MIPYPHIDPVIFRVGPLAVRWYGMMYVLGFVSSYLLVLWQISRKRLDVTRTQVEDLYFYLVLGLLVGGRLGYVLFYNLPYYIDRPLEILVLWHGGMSFHGAAIGVFVAGYVVTKKRGIDFFRMADVIMPTVPIGLFFGRLANFINGELFGRVSEAPWAMIFPDGAPIPRHPSQLYEAGLEGAVLFLILWFYKDRKKRDGDVLAMFLMFYGIFRLFCEFFREPDVQVGYLFGLITMGQLLSLAMVAIGLFLKFVYLPKRPAKPLGSPGKQKTLAEGGHPKG
jgi:phosphatidylglycerol---prolipoprotein diacylglyceryl transferase